MQAIFMIILVACLGGQDSQCREFALSTDQTDKKGCETVAQPMIAMWWTFHHQWQPRGFSCRPNKPQMEI